MGSLRIIAPGLLTTIQDRGRWGWQSQGVAVAGAMDLCAHRLANALVGNDVGAATLETTIAGPEIEFDDERSAAVAGADFELTVDGRGQAVNSPFSVRAGSTLRFGRRRRGARAYLAISGGVEVPVVLGSRATHLPSAMGGYAGRVLRAGDRLPLGKMGRESFHTGLGDRPGRRENPHGPVSSGQEMTPVPFFLPDGKATLRVLPGPQLDHFAADALAVLQSTAYVIEPASNRMGFRLRGPAVRHTGDVEMLSDATPFGAVQVPRGGQPILLMADRQTTGGYPNVAIVISADIPLAGQLAPGDAISFALCTRAEAMAALIAQEQALMTFEAGPKR